MEKKEYPDRTKVPYFIFDVKFNYHGELSELSTEAPSESVAKNNVVFRMSQKYRVKPFVIRGYINNNGNCLSIKKRP